METVNVLILNASLKKEPESSNTQEVAEMVVGKMRDYADISYSSVHLINHTIPAGVSFDVGDGDEWPAIAQKMKDADIILFATPIWWGHRSSLMQKIIERMDSFDEGDSPLGKKPMLNKVAGIVITGSEDGAQAIMAGLTGTLSFMNFTLPPQCCTYWVGEVGQDPKTDPERRRKNEAVGTMAEETAKSLVHTALLLKQHPFPSDKN